MPGLTWLQIVTRRLILQKARGHPFRFHPGIGLPLIVGTRFQVLFHSAQRGSFHLSLTVLVHYRSSRVFSLGRWTARFPTGLACPVVLRKPNRASQLSHTGLSPSAVHLSSSVLLTGQFLTRFVGSYNPVRTSLTVWAAPRSLATTSGMVSFPRLTKMFQFSRFPCPGLCVQPGTPGDEPREVSPFGHLRLSAC